MKRTISIGIIGILLSAILLASVPSAMGAQFFGDANEDGTIDIKDVTYVKLIIFGKKPTTELADANQDGRINVGDVIQIKLIILRKVPFGRVVIPVSGDFMKGTILNKGMAPTASIMYEGLVTKNSWEDTYDCWLAESWEVSNDAKIYTFHLKKNAKWHDGVPVTSEDVKFTHDYIKSKKLGTLSSVLSKVDRVECPDDYTAVFYLKSSYPVFLDKLSHYPGVVIIPKHIWENVDDPDTFEDTEYIGSGPFKFKKRIPGEYFVLEANKEYHSKMPRVKEVVFKVMPSKDVQILAVQKGEIDAICDIRPAVANMLKGRKNIKVYSAPYAIGGGVGFNVENYPANITAFRKAMAHAISKEKFINNVFGGHAALVYTFLLPSAAHDFVNYDVPKYDYDLAETKRLLKSAGFDDIDEDDILEGPDGEDVTITIPIGGGPAGNAGVDEEIAQVLKNDWKELGIEVNIKQVGFSQWFKEVHKNPVFIAGLSHLGNDDPDDLCHFGTKAFFGKPNWYDYSNPEYDQLIEEIRSTADREERKEIGYKMQEILGNDLPFVPICSGDAMFAYRSDGFVGWEWEEVHPLSRWLTDIKVLLNIQPAQW
jgi:peptide/nickel transport system substrate-binding protein